MFSHLAGCCKSTDKQGVALCKGSSVVYYNINAVGVGLSSV